MDRRDFLRNAGWITTWLGVAVVIQGCSDDGDDPVSPAAGDTTGVIGTNHGHTVIITSAQVQAGNSVTLSLSGGGHAHTVSLAAQQVSDIGAGMKVQAVSTSDSGHTHGVTFN